jgi:hypothetical protein
VALQHLSGGGSDTGGADADQPVGCATGLREQRATPAAGFGEGGCCRGGRRYAWGRGAHHGDAPTLIQPSRVRPPAFRRDSGGGKRGVALHHPSWGGSDVTVR